MLHHPSKYHTNPLSHLLALHTTAAAAAAAAATATVNCNSMGSGKIEPENGVNSTHLDEISGSIGKSFTIAAILGLKKNAAGVVAMDHHHHEHHHHHHNNHHQQQQQQQQHHHHHSNLQSGKDFAVMNLSLNSGNKNSVNFNSDSFPTTDNRCSLGNSGGGGGGNSSANGTGVNNINSSRLSLNFGQHFNAHHHHSQHGTSASALQSLQHLQQQHSAQTGPVYQGRDKNQHMPKKSTLKSKRVRTIFTPEQLERLESEFERQQYMVGPERLYLAHTLQLTEAQVKVWFQNRRIKWRKHHLELTQQRLAIIRQRQISNSSVAGAGTVQSTVPAAIAESDLSICTDSMDGKSIQDGDL